MSIHLTRKNRNQARKAVSVFTALATMLWLSGVVFLAPVGVHAAVPGDFGLTEGDTISATGSSDPDVYIVNEQGYKRLFLNPVIFGFYGHLGGFSSVKSVSSATRDAFLTSGLFRNCESGAEEVYGVETTGEDTGKLHHVNVTGAQAVSQDANFFKKVFCINNNEFNWYTNNGTSFGTPYSSVNDVPDYSRDGGTVVTPGSMTVSLAPDNPPATTITLNAYGETVMSVRFSGTGTIDSLSFKRQGPGATGDFDNLYVYDGAERLTGGRTPSSADGTLTFVNLNLDVNGTKDIDLVADHSGTAGNVNYWVLESVTLESGNISGFPVQSNNFTFAGSNSGTINVDKTGSVANPKVGQKMAHLSTFKITANTESAHLKRVSLLNGGTVKDADITNLYLEVNGDKVANGWMNGDGDAVFEFSGSGYSIAKGDNKIFKVYGDLSGKKDETIKFYVEQASDVLAVGDQFGFGMAPTVDANFDDSTNTHSLTLQGGVLTLTFNGPNATNVGTDTQDTVLAQYSMSAASDIEVKKLRLVLCQADAGTTYADASDTTNGWADLDDIKVIDEDTGQVIVGPADGSAFTASEATGCPNGATGAAKTFTDTFDLSAGTTRNFKVTGDINIANTRAGQDLVATDTIKVVLDGYGESDLVGTAGDIAVMKYAGTNTAVDDSDIVPNTDLAGNNMTLQASSLTLGLSASPVSTTYVRGTQNVDALGITFAASLASGLEVTDITLSAYVADSGSTTALGVGASPDTSLSVGGLVSAVELWDATSGTLISNSPSANNLNTSTGTIVFNNLGWDLAAGETRTLLVRTDLSSNSTSGASDVFNFDIAATTDVTAIDDSGSSVNAANSAVNGTTSPTVLNTVSSAGTLAVTAAPDMPITGAKYWGQTDAEFARYRFRSTNEAFYIERLNINSGDTTANLTANVDKVKIRYTNEAGDTLTSVGTLNTAGSVSFAFTGSNRPYVPKDSSIDIKVLADLKTKAQGATSEVSFSLDFSGGATDEFRALGVGSGTLVEGNDTTGDDTDSVTGNDHYIYRVYPEFVQDTLAASEPLGTKDVLKFTIKAHGLSDSKLYFDDPASVTLKFDTVASGGASSNMTANLYDVGTGELLASATITAGQANGASISFTNWEKDVEITGGSQKSFRVEVGFTNFLDTSDYFQVVLRDEAGVIKYVDGARTGEDQEVTNVANVFKLLPMNGPIFSKQ
ncbi:MAG: hypothetical protein COV29_03095 [Candidatus Yanofskybacteria bacterium CG10_big_fil_rev_8_21_14_0_10_36_16]|uniref:Uncharacterized protein n=1 Tax=Candidatus Yanofskybacteria bacterium CG10_big_fil_rev_8_21_14_0_10_36_16 TaxID=1975096 RepID=A0A2J0Q9M9_9BACT|nr:MAG: hypothetical protein COV29_03095 [Candidatus Yanofskybacteria bacterium CG10_big_fil_rev_8_21_14_0_10_36_16]